MLCGDFAPALLAPLLGTLADRVELKRLMLVCAVGQTITTAMIAIWLPSLLLLLVLFTVRAVLEQVFLPASRTAVTALVPDASLPSANGALGFGEHGLSVIGPLVAGGLLMFTGIQGLLLVDAISFLASAWLLAKLPRMNAEKLGLEQEGSFLRHASEGLRFLWRSGNVRLVVFSFVAGVAFTGIDDVALIFLAKGPLESSDTGVSFLYAGSAAGLLVGFAVVSQWGSLVTAPALLVTGNAISSVGNLLTGVSWVLATAFILQTVRGLGIAAADVSAATLIQRGVSREMQGRTFGNFYGAIGLAAGVSYVFGGLLVHSSGPRVTFVVAGVGGLMVAAYTATRFRLREKAPSITPEGD